MNATAALWMILAATTPKPIVLAVTPRICFAPCEVRVRLTIEPNENNRSFCIGIESDTPGAVNYPNSCLSLDGAKAAKTREIWYHSLPGGEYDIAAQVGRNDGSVVRTESFHIQVLSNR